MRVIVLVLMILSFAAVPLCQADEDVLKKAKSLYYKGQQEHAIEMVEDYVQENPDPSAYYFLGYAYYEMQQMDKANEYFSEAFRLRDFYSPMPPAESQ